jgi:hypothetical protein
METLIGGHINYMPHGLGTIWQEMPVIRIPSLRRRSAWSDGKSVGGISVAMSQRCGSQFRAGAGILQSIPSRLPE